MLNAKSLIALSFLIIALSIGYYFVIHLPHVQQVKLEAEQAKAKAAEEARVAQEKRESWRELELDNCLNEAEKQYSYSWDTACKSVGVDTTKPNCRLPSDQADTINQYRKGPKEECYKRYK